MAEPIQSAEELIALVKEVAERLRDHDTPDHGLNLTGIASICEDLADRLDAIVALVEEIEADAASHLLLGPPILHECGEAEARLAKCLRAVLNKGRE